MIPTNCFRTALICALPAALAFSSPSSAQSAADAYPSRPVTLVIPVAAGGPTDVEGRLYSKKMSELLGQPFVLDYKAGAGGTIGTAIVAKAPADGYTLLVIAGSFTVMPAVYKNLSFDTLKDFAPLSLMSEKPQILLASSSFAARTYPEYLAYAKANPGKINIGTSGITGAGHLSLQLLHHLTGTKATFIHYKGGAATFAAVQSGELDVVIGSVIGAGGMVRAGKVKVLGIMSAQRIPQFPDMPAIAEGTVPGWEYAPWQGYAAPAKTPAALLDRINAEFVKVAKDPVLGEKLSSDATIMIGSTRQEFTKFVTAEAVRLKKVVADTGLKLEE